MSGPLLLGGSPLAAILHGYGNRMRIAHVAPSAERVASGVQTAVEELARVLSHRGHDVELWHVGDWSPPLEATTVDAMRLARVRCRRLVAHQRRRSLLPAID